MSNPFTILNPARLPELPCSSCQSECCHLAPAFRQETEKITAYLKDRPELVVKLRGQERPEGKCPFVDMETHRCGVYPVRPHVCEMFGRTSTLTCRKEPRRAAEIPYSESFGMRMGLLMREGGKKSEYTVLGADTTWDTIEVEFEEDVDEGA